MRIEHPTPGGRRADARDIFVGQAETQTVIGAEARDLHLTEVTFRDGARNKLHTHTTDQILVVTAGEGILATEREQRDLGVGDIAYIPAGERHWHGAKPGRDMTHLAILGSGKTYIVADDRPAD